VDDEEEQTGGEGGLHPTDVDATQVAANQVPKFCHDSEISDLFDISKQIRAQIGHKHQG
jgi:hypothetical protein